MQLSLLPVAFPQAGLPRSFGGPAREYRGTRAVISRAQGGFRMVPAWSCGGTGHGTETGPARSRRGPIRPCFLGTTWSTGSPMSRKPATELPIEQIKAAQSGTSQRGKSALYKWMWDHFDQLDVDRRGRPDWVAATEQYSQLGLTDVSGEATEAENVRRVWERVVRDRLAIAKSRTVCHIGISDKGTAPSPSLLFAAEPVAFEFRTLRRTPIRKQE